MKITKNNIIVLIAIIILAIIVFMFFTTFNTNKNKDLMVVTGEIVEVIKKGYVIEADNLDDKNTFKKVNITSNTLEFKQGDYIKVSGNKQNNKDLTIKASEIIKTSYINEYSPTIASKELEDVTAQFGYIIKLDKIELAKEETRVYITVKNFGEGNIDFVLEESLATQNDNEYKYQENLKAKHPKIKKQLTPGEESKGIITFSALEKGVIGLKLVIKSNNDQEIIEDYIFGIGI